MTPAENITRAYAGDWHGSYGAIPTAGHSTRDRGTTVKDAADGGVVFNSFNGGDWRALKEDCERRGLLDTRERAEGGGGGGWRETGRYEYVGPDGAVAYRTVRKEKAGERKRFVAQRPDGRGGWLNGLGEVERVLYRLPDIKAAIGCAALRDEPLPLIYLTEGERKADRLASWGLVATAVAFGAKGWRDVYADALAGCTVAILPDNDDEGRGFADKARDSIIAAGGNPVLVELPDLPLKGDVMDWRGDAAELQRLVEAALSEPVPLAETLPIADLTAWARTAPTAKRFAMAGVIPEKEVTLLTGPGGSNKSTFGIQLCGCSAAGLPMLGVAVAPGPALYVTAEDDDPENHWRLSKIAGTIGTTLERLAGRLHVVSLRGRLNNELATFDAEGRLHVAPTFKLLRATIEATGSKLVVLDNVAHLFVGNENDRGQVTGFLNLLYQLCRELDATVVLIGHPNKAGDSYSGSTAWLNAVRSQIVLERPEGLDTDARVLTLGKANYARPDQQLTFRWHDFALVLDSDMSDEWRSNMAATIAANAAADAFLACLRERDKQGEGRGVGPASGPNYAPVQFETMPQARGLKRDALKRAMDALFQSNAIETFDHKVPGKGRSVTLIREAGAPPERTPERLPNTPPEHPRTVLPNTPTHTPYTTYKGGAFSGPPPHEEQNLSRSIFAADPPAFDDPFAEAGT